MSLLTTSEPLFYTLQQLRATTQAGGVSSIVLKGQGSGFFIQIHTRSAQTAILVTAKDRQPRQFKSPSQAFNVLREMGIMVGSFDLSQYSPEQRETPLAAQSTPLVNAEPEPNREPASEHWKTLVDEIYDSAQGTFDEPALKVNDDQAKKLYGRLNGGSGNPSS